MLHNLNTRNLFLCILLCAATSHAAPNASPAKFDEVYQLLRANLKLQGTNDLDAAAIKGLLAQFPGQAMLVAASGASAKAESGRLVKTAVFDDSYAYFRIGKVEDKVADQLRAAYEQLARTNKSKIKGVVLDLRFAGGTDYAAAAATADCFLNSDRLLLDWGAGSARATKKPDAITAPLAILVNGETTGAAEAVAAALRESSIGLILGSATAGQARVFKDFPLGGGEILRIATNPIKLGDGTPLAHGLVPDIEAPSSLADEKAWLGDPYKDLHPAALPAGDSGTNNVAESEPPRRPTNEAELVRERRSGESLDDDDNSIDQNVPDQPPPPPVIADTSLARALDLLKGIAVLQQSRPG